MLMRHLFFFVTLAQEKHFKKAADLCNVTQPTLSTAIRKLEEDLGAALVVRDHRYIGLTPEGEKALAWGRQILADYDSLKDDLHGMQTGLTGTLRLGVIPAAMPCVSFLTERICARHSRIQVDIRSMTSRAIQRALDIFEIDGGVTYLDNEPLQNVHRLPLYHERYVFVCRPDHPLASLKTITWSQAVKEPLCLLSEDMQNRRILNTIAASVGLSIVPPVVSNSFLAVCAHLRNGKWCGIVPHTFLYIFGRTSDLAWVDLTEPQQRHAIGLVLTSRSPQSPIAAALVGALQDADFDERFEEAIGLA
jgi:DNA-binding transcriptional LysR family regulator